MELRGDTRGQAIQIGAILLFAALVISFSAYQATVVPDQNKRVEFNHNDKVQQQFTELRNSLVTVSRGGTSRPVTLDLGVRYPSRAMAINPGPASGNLRTINTDDPDVEIRIENAKATDGEIADFWDGTVKSYDTGRLVYTPSYNVYNEAPKTVYDNTVLFNQFEEAAVTETDQQLVDDTRISLVALDGSLAEASTDGMTISPEAASVSNTTVDVTNDGGDLTLVIPTQLDVSTWRELLDDQTTPDGHIESIDPVTDIGSSTVDGIEITLESGVTYQFQHAKVGVGTDVTDDSTAYLTPVSGDGVSVTQDKSTDITLEVRDKFDNTPDDATSADIEANIVGDGSLDSTSKTPNAAGKVAFTYTAPSAGTGSQTIEFSRGDTTFSPATVSDASVSVDVTDSGSGSGSAGTSDPNDDTASGAGGGSYSDASEDSTEVVSDSSNDGVWDNVDTLQHVYLSQLVIDNNNEFEGKTQEFKLKFEVRDKDSDDQYKFEVKLKYDWDTDSWEKNEVTIKDTDDNKVVDKAALETAELDSIYVPVDGSGKLDLLDNDDYQSSPWSSSEETDLQDFVDSETYIIFTEIQKGSVKIELG